MIEFNEIFCLDLRDDFEEMGRNERNFTLKEFIQDDISRAFAFGYCHIDWMKDKMWFPVSIRKALRHNAEGLEHYRPQIEWLSKKYPSNNGTVKISEYASYILDNLFCDNRDELIRVAMEIGLTMRMNIKNE